MHLTGLLGRIVYALLCGVATFVVLLIIGAIVNTFDANIGGIIQKYAAIIGLLFGLVVFLGRKDPGGPIL